MKKMIVPLLLLSVYTGTIQAQVLFSFGPGVGFNYSLHTASDGAESYTHFGPLVTGQVDMQLSRHFSILVWMDFLSDMSVNTTNYNYEYKYKVNYFHLSPTLKFCLPGSHFYLFGGPGIGIKETGKVKARMNSSIWSAEQDLLNMRTRFDLRFGAGYEFFLSNKFTFTPFAAFNVGLNSVASNSDWHINALQAGIVLRFNAY